jgi:multiple sugar transport system permease protein
MRLGRLQRRNLRTGLLFISPWIVGFVLFLAYPVVYNFRLGLTRFSGFTTPVWVGLANYRAMIHDPLFWTSIYNTMYYVVLAVPIGVVVAILMALAMHQRVREVPIYRTALYLPAVAPVFALSLVFIWFLNPRYGMLNYLITLVHLPSINWLGDPTWTKLAMVMLAQLQAGQYALIFLAAIRAVPNALHEAAVLDGANGWQRFRNVTLPLITPVILYDIIIGLGLGLQIFVPAYIMTGGGPLNATMFNALYIYTNAFEYSRMGYAAAMSGTLFVINVVLAVLVYWSARYWVHYEVT